MILAGRRWSRQAKPVGVGPSYKKALADVETSVPRRFWTELTARDDAHLQLGS